MGRGGDKEKHKDEEMGKKSNLMKRVNLQVKRQLHKKCTVLIHLLLGSFQSHPK